MDNNQDYTALRKRLRNVTAAFGITALALAVAIIFCYTRVRRLEEFRKRFSFFVFALDYERNEDLLAPQVGTVHFLKRGYSVTLDAVGYTTQGLALKGRIGNPTNIWVSSLTLQFEARPDVLSLDKKWEERDKWGWNAEWNIGSAETNVGVLAPGATAAFEVTIPNVKQTSKAIELAVSFMGERYGYDK
jgi:hypothetical protein